MRRTLALAAAAVLVAGSAAAGPLVIVVRHAEKADASNDPALSAAGEARAVTLAAVLESTPPTHVFVSPFRRTQATAAPASRSAFRTVVGLEQGPEFHVKQIADAVSVLPDSATVLVVGHSNTVPAIVRALGGAAADMPDCEYDRLTILDLRTGASPETVRYGAPSACPAS